MGGEMVPSLPGMEGEIDERTEAQLRAEEARRTFEARYGEQAWMEDYWELLAEGWDWRKAVYIVWASLPREQRVPGTQLELARKVLGLTSDRRIREWKASNPALEQRVKGLTISALEKARADIIAALIESASDPNPRCTTDRRMALEILDIYKSEATLRVGEALPEDLVGMSEEELAKLADGVEGNG
jgi:hypothetical protein